MNRPLKLRRRLPRRTFLKSAAVSLLPAFATWCQFGRGAESATVLSTMVSSGSAASASTNDGRSVSSMVCGGSHAVGG